MTKKKKLISLPSFYEKSSRNAAIGGRAKVIVDFGAGRWSDLLNYFEKAKICNQSAVLLAEKLQIWNGGDGS